MDKNNNQRHSKKTESIEIRLPFETKSALLKRASIDDRSMSDVVRHLIDQYLTGNHDFRMHSSSLKRRFTRKHRKTVGALAALSTILALTFGFIVPSQADDVQLTIGGWITKGYGDATISQPDKNNAIELIADSVSTINLKDTVTTDYGDTISIRHQAGNSPTYVLELTPKQTDQDTIHIAITLKSIDGKIERTLATPTILVADRKNARITISDKDNASVYSIEVTAKKL